MRRTMTDKILARAAGIPVVRPGRALLARVSLLALPDSERFIDLFAQHGLRVWDPLKIVFCFDHYAESWMKSAAEVNHPRLLDFARTQGIPEGNLYHLERRGISHHVPVEQGWVLPGTVTVGADTQAATMGAANSLAVPSLSSGTTSVIISGELWIVAPECVELSFHGTLCQGVLGKDVVYHLIRMLGGSLAGRVVEVSGPGVAGLPIDARMAIANGSVQIGALSMIFPCDDRLTDYLRQRMRGPYEAVSPDPDAAYVARHIVDLGAIEPLVSGPHDIDLIRPLGAVLGTEVNAAYIGSCSSGRLEDLALAATVLRGRRIASDLRLVVTPISGAVAAEAEATGLLQIFRDAGATVTDPGCGACYHGNRSPLKLADHERCISSSVENMPGRMGSTDAEVYLGNAAVVAASAIEGRIADPAPYLEGAR